MPISAPTEVASGSAKTAGSTLVATLTVAVSVGDIIVVCTAEGNSGASLAGCAVTGITDTGSNSYAVAVATNRSTTWYGDIWTARCTTAMAIGATITITFGASPDDRAALVYKVSGAPSTSWVDKTASSTGFTTALTTGATATLAQAAELVIAAFAVGEDTSSTDGGVGTTMAAGGSYTRLRSLGSGDGAGALSMAVFTEYKIVAATTAVTGDGTLGASRNFSGLVVTLKEDPGLSVTAPPASATGSSPAPTVVWSVQATAGLFPSASTFPSSTTYPAQAAQPTATASAPAPAVSFLAVPPAALATATSPTPAVLWAVTAPAGAATGAAPAPVVGFVAVPLTVTAPPATATATALAPTFTYPLPAVTPTEPALTLTPLAAGTLTAAAATPGSLTLSPATAGTLTLTPAPATPLTLQPRGPT